MRATLPTQRPPCAGTAPALVTWRPPCVRKAPAISTLTRPRLPTPPRAAGVEPSPTGRVGSVHDGAYGRWVFEQADFVEVAAYRASLGVAAAGFAAAVAAPDAAGTPAAAAVAAGLVAASSLIHIYVTPIKRAIQALAVAGAVGTAAVATTAGAVPAAVAADPALIWLVGPAAAAATGIGIKEGLCYGKPEAAGLAATLPVACLAHLSGLVPADVDHALAIIAASFAVLFAARKLAQPAVEDLGDKSVFEFRNLNQAEQAARLAVLAKQTAFLDVVEE